MTLKTLITAAFLTLASTTAHAHQLWIEPGNEPGTAKVCYGEYAEGQVETAGGELDKISSVVAYGAERSKPLSLSRHKDHFLVSPVAGDVRVIEEGLAPYPGRQGKTKYVFSARYGRRETAAASACEIVPVDADSNTLRVMLNGKPVPQAKVTVVTRDRWSKSFVADEQGRVTIQTPTKGLCVIESIVPEARSGGEGDGAYARTVHVVTLSFIVE